MTISDNGPGVPPEVATRLFEPFVTSRAAEGGLGIGLSLSHTLAEEMSGTLRHRRSADGWTHFSLRLPAGDAA